MGYLKQKVYSQPVQNLSKLKERITNHVSLIEQETLERAFLKLEKRLLLIQANDGTRIEQLIE